MIYCFQVCLMRLNDMIEKTFYWSIGEFHTNWFILWELVTKAYLPGAEVNHDQEGGSSKARSCHCTSTGLTLTITPNVGNLSAQFLSVGTAFALSLTISHVLNHITSCEPFNVINSNVNTLPQMCLGTSVPFNDIINSIIGINSQKNLFRFKKSTLLRHIFF